MSHQRHYSEGTAYDLSVPLASPSHHSAGPSRTPVTAPAQPHPQSQSHSYPHPHSSHRDPLSHPHPHSQQQSHQSHQSHPYAQPAMAASQALRKSPTSSAQDSRGQTASPALDQSAGPVIRRVGGKANVSSACGPCKRAHLACDVGRPCKRCINMGKEDQCEDVPHKKRGRPKVVKPALGQPYSRVLPPIEDPNAGKWRGAPPSGYPPLDPPASIPSARPIDPELTYTSSAPLFTLFTTTELKILRVSPACYALTGYHPHEYVNSSLLDWLHPSDRLLVEMERVRLITVPFVSVPLQSDRDTQAGIMHRSERELLSPAEGMREPYPNQNVRVVRSDNHFSLFNVRLHLGGGLGASLWRAETLGRIYLVVSLLLITTRTDTLPPEFTSRRPSPLLPPTPMSSASAQQSQSQSQSQGQAPAQGLPSFSSIAAAADAPARYDPTPQPPPSYYASAPPPPVRPPPPPAPSSGGYPGYARTAPLSTTYLPPPPRSPSPPPVPPYRQPGYAQADYPPAPAPFQPQPPSQAYYDPRTAPLAPPDSGSGSDPYRRQVSTEDEWGRRTPSNEYGRRAWEL